MDDNGTAYEPDHLPSSQEYITSSQWFVYEFFNGEDYLPPGIALIHVQWHSYLPPWDELGSTGLYWGYFPESSSSEIFITTQFQPAFARLAIPCFDEPLFKSIWNFTYTVPSTPGYTVVANTKEISTSPQTAYLRDTNLKVQIHQFEDTPAPMSTYLVALGIGNFTFTEQISPLDSVRYRVYSYPTLASQRDLGLNESINSMIYMSSLYNQNYTLNKLDSLASPYRGGAMENWGLVIYAYDRLLVDTLNSTFDYTRSAMSTVYHELVHQWFGDTVTCPWWNQAFLNEAFATYYSFVVGVYLHPEWDYPTFFAGRYTRTLQTDETGLNNAVIKPENLTTIQSLAFDLDGAFDDLTYSKGGGVLRMFREFVQNQIPTPAPAWDTAIAWYVNHFRFENPSFDDLITALVDNRVDPQTVAGFSGWLTQSGYPVIKIVVQSNSNSSGMPSIEFTQSPSSMYLNSNTSWFVPIPYRMVGANQTDLGSNTSFALKSTYGNISDNIPKDLQYVIGNVGGAGFYAVSYDESGWTGIIGALQNNVSFLSYPEKISIITSAFASARISNPIPGALSDLTIALRVTSALGTDPSEPVWTVLLSQWTAFSVLVPNQVYYGTLQKYVVDSMAGVLNTFSPLGNNFTNSMNYTDGFVRQALFVGMYFGSTRLINQANQYFNNGSSQSLATLPSTVRRAVMYGLVRYGGLLEYQAVKNLLMSSVGDVAADALFALSAPKDTYLCPQTIALIDSNTTSIQSKILAVSPMLLYNWQCRMDAYNYILGQWDALVNSSTVTNPAGLWRSWVPQVPGLLMQIVADKNGLSGYTSWTNEYASRVWGSTWVAKQQKIAGLQVDFVSRNNQTLAQFLGSTQ